MGQPKDFLDFIIDTAGRSLRKNAGLVEAISTPTPLPQTPDGWQEKSIRYTRNTKWWGVFRSFTTPLKFVKDGAFILRDQVIKYGTEAKLYLVILWLDKRFGGGWIHRSLYKGELDLTTVNSEENFVTVNIMEGDLMKFIKANENTPFEIPIDVPEAIYIKDDGIPLQSTVNYALLKSLAAQSMGRKQMLPMTLFLNEGNRFNFVFNNDYGDLINGAANEITSEDLTISDKWMFKATKAAVAKVTIPGSIIGSGGNAGNKWLIETSTGQLIEIGTIEHTLSGVAVPFNISATVNLAEGEKVFVYRTSTTFNNNGLWNYTDVTRIVVTTIDKHDESFIKSLRPAYVAQELLNKMTGSTTFIFASDYLTEVWENLTISSGNAIRGLEGSVLKTSWNDFLESYNVPCNICMKISGRTLRIEKKADAFTSNIIGNLGQVRDFEWKILSEELFSSFRIGYPDINYEDINGKYEFNTEQSWVGPLKKTTKSFELISKYRADGYGKEFIRIKGVGKDTTDLKSDNDVFFLHVEKLGHAGTGSEPPVYFNYLRKSYTSITGLLQPNEVINLEISPKRCLFAHANYLRSIFYWESGKELTLGGAKKDVALKTVDGFGTVIEERANEFIGNLAAPLFIPIEFKATSRISRELLASIEADPTGTVLFTNSGDPVYGFPMDIGIQPASMPSQDTIMLCSPVTDITQFIN